MQFLLQRFAGGTDLGDPSVRARAGVFAEWFHIVCNLILFLIKLLTSFFIHSIAVRADAFHNLAYVFSALFRIYAPAKNESTKEKRGRYALAFLAAFFIFETGFSFFTRAFSGFTKADQLTGTFPAAIVLAAVIIFRLYEASCEMYLGEKTEAQALLASAKSAGRNCVLTGITLAAVLIERIFHVHLDHLAAVVISVSVMVAGIRIAFTVVHPSIEEAPDPELVRTVRAKVRAYSGILGIGRTETKFFGEGRRLLIMQVMVPEEGSETEQFHVLREIEKAVEKETDVSLALHMERTSSQERELLLIRSRLEEETDKTDPLCSVGPLYMAAGSSFTNLMFDLFVPNAYNEDRRRALSEEISARMRSINPRYSCIIEVRDIR